MYAAVESLLKDVLSANLLYVRTKPTLCLVSLLIILQLLLVYFAASHWSTHLFAAAAADVVCYLSLLASSGKEAY